MRIKTGCFILRFTFLCGFVFKGSEIVIGKSMEQAQKHEKKISEKEERMDEKWMGFMVWCVCGLLMIGIGICALFSKKPVNFWANANVGEVNDVKRYNCAVAKLFCLYGMVFIVLGIPLLAGQNSAWILLSSIGVMIESIMAMVIDVLVIEKKYKKR